MLGAMVVFSFNWLFREPGQFAGRVGRLKSVVGRRARGQGGDGAGKAKVATGIEAWRGRGGALRGRVEARVGGGIDG